MPAFSLVFRCIVRMRLLHLCTLLLIISSYCALLCAARDGSQMSVADVAAWIGSIGLAQYAGLIESQRIDGAALSRMTSEALQAAGVTALGHRKKILRHWRNLLSSEESSAQCGTDGAQSQCSSSTLAVSSALSSSHGRAHLPHGVEDASTMDDNGGWTYPAYGQAYETERCNIDIRSQDMSSEEFLRDFHLRKPVLLVPDAARAALIRRVRAHWTRQHLLDEHGAVEVALGTPLELTAFGDGKSKVKLREYIDGLTRESTASSSGSWQYLFDRSDFLRTCPELLDSYTAPALFDSSGSIHASSSKYSSTLTFALGSSRSGLAFHTHKDGWNEVIFGRKRWVLYPPSVGTPPRGFNQFEEGRAWIDAHYSSLAANEMPIECMQYPGETMYVPEDWWHLTVNIGDTLAIAGQARKPADGSLMDLVTRAMELPSGSDESLRLLEQAKTKQPNAAGTHNLLGNFYRGKGEFVQAQKAYEEATRLNPSYALAWTALGGVDLELSAVSEASHAYARAVELAPNFFDALLGMAQTFLMREDFTGALPLLRQAVAASSGMERSKKHSLFVNLVVSLSALKEHKEAISVAEKWLKEDPADKAMLLAYAASLRGDGRMDDARRTLQRVLNEDPAHEVAQRDLRALEEEIKRAMKPAASSASSKTASTISTPTPAASSKAKPATKNDAAVSSAVEPPTGRGVLSDPKYFTRRDKSGALLPYANLAPSTARALRNWRKEVLTRFVQARLTAASEVAIEQGDAPSLPRLHVFQSVHSIKQARNVSSSGMMRCILTSATDPAIETTCIWTGGEIDALADTNFAHSLMDHGAILTLGALLPERDGDIKEHDWIGITPFDEAERMGQAESCFRTLLTRTDRSVHSEPEFRNEPEFVDEILSLPYVSLRGLPVTESLVGLDSGPVSARMPEHDLYKFLEENHPGAGKTLLHIFRRMALPGCAALKELPPYPRGQAFYSNMFALSRSAFTAYWEFLILFLHSAFKEGGPMERPWPGRSFSYLLERLPSLWAFHAGRPLLYAQTLDYIHDDDPREDPPLFAAENVHEAFEKLLLKSVDKKLAAKYQAIKPVSRSYKLNVETAASAPTVTAPSLSPNDSSPFLAHLCLPLVFPAGLLRLSIEGRFDLSLLHPNTARLVRFPEVLELATVAPVLHDPALPVLTNSNAATNAAHAENCSAYMATRVVSAQFPVSTHASWAQTTEGRLYGVADVFEIVGDLARNGQARGPVFIGWDGTVFTSSTIFTFEKRCVAGLFCAVEELVAMGLAEMRSHDPDNPALRGEIRVGRPLDLALHVRSPFVFTGAELLGAYGKMSAEAKKMKLGIQTDHLQRMERTFLAQLKLVPSPPAPVTPGRLVPSSEHGYAASAKSSRCQPVLHHYPVLIVAEHMSTVNFAHWLGEVAPKILLMRPLLLRRPHDVRILVQPNAWIDEWMELAGIPRASVVFAHPCVLHSADRVYVASPMPLDAPSIQSLSLVRNALMRHPAPALPARPIPSPYFPPRSLSPSMLTLKRAILSERGPYIVSLFRPATEVRSVTNADAVEEELGKAFPRHRIARFDPSTYTLNETIALFSGASAVVGVSGAGFANLAFSSPPTLVLELIPGVSHSRLACGVTPWWHLSEVLQLPFRALVMQHAHFLGEPFEVPLDDFRSFLRQVHSLMPDITRS